MRAGGCMGSVDRREDGIAIKALTKHMHVPPPPPKLIRVNRSAMSTLPTSSGRENLLEKEQKKQAQLEKCPLPIPTCSRPSDSTLGPLLGEMQSGSMNPVPILYTVS